MYQPTGKSTRVHQSENGWAYEYCNWEERDPNTRIMAPAGGYFKGLGIDVKFQNGPIPPGQVANGGFVEDLLYCVKYRMEHYQGLDGDSEGAFACYENAMILKSVNDALTWCKKRTDSRKKQGVEGTLMQHESDESEPVERVGSPAPRGGPKGPDDSQLAENRELARKLWGENPPDAAHPPLPDNSAVISDEDAPSGLPLPIYRNPADQRVDSENLPIARVFVTNADGERMEIPAQQETIVPAAAKTDDPAEMQRRSCDLVMNGHVDFLAQAYEAIYHQAFAAYMVQADLRDDYSFTEKTLGADRCATYVAGRSMGAMFDWDSIGELTG